MKRLVKGIFFLGLALLVASLIAPSFIDWSQHKEKILSQISPYFQRKIDVAGRISFKIIPQPELLLEQVTVANAAGAKSDSLMTLKSLEARVKLKPLLEGRVEVESINLTEPVLNLEILEDGRAAWAGVLAPSKDAGVAATAVKLNLVTITKGAINYTNLQTGSKRSFENLDLSVTAETLLGPYHISGNMMYQDAKVNVDISTDAFYDRTVSAPVHLSFMPVEDGVLPQVRFNGVVDLQSGLDIQGELSLSQGRLGSLFNVGYLKALGFMHDTVDMAGVMDFKGDKFALNDIKAKFGKGSLKGKMFMQFSRSDRASVILDIEGSDLKITEKASASYMDVPGDFKGSLHFKGKNILWDGRQLAWVDISTAFNQKEWTVKSAQVSLPGNSQVKLSGVITPKTSSAVFASAQITTDDLSKMIGALGPGDNSIFQSLGASGIIKKFSLSSSLELSPSKINFSNIDATIDDKEKISGVFNVDRSAAKPNFVAGLNFLDWDDADFPAPAYDEFLKKILKSKAYMELTATNYIKNGIKIQEMSFKGKTDEQGLEIEDLSGRLSDRNVFTVKGRVADLAPVSGMALSYTLKTAQLSDVVVSLNMDLPSLLLSGKKLDLKGDIKGDAQKYSFTVQGSGDDLAWQGQHISKPVLAMEANPSSIKITGLEGMVWDGKLKADVLFVRKGQSQWSCGLRGTLKQADLSQLQGLMGFRGFSAGLGNIDFELTSPDGFLATAMGEVGLRAATVTVEKFNFEKLGDKISQLTVAPANIQGFVDNILRKSGAATYKNVQGKFNLDRGKISVETLKLPNAQGDATVTGAADAAAGSYNLSGELHLVKPEGFPALKMQSSSGTAGYMVYGQPIGDFIMGHNTQTIAPVAAPIPPQDTSAIKDIVKRLDEEGASPPAPESAPAVPAPAPVPDPAPVQP